MLSDTILFYYAVVVGVVVVTLTLTLTLTLTQQREAICANLRGTHRTLIPSATPLDKNLNAALVMETGTTSS